MIKQITLSELNDELAQTKTKKKELLTVGRNVHDVTITSELLSGEEEIVYGDSGYIGAEKRDDAITRNKHGKKSNTESIANQVRSNFSPKAASTRLKRMNTKNLLFELKLNMFSLLSKTFSLFVKLDTGANESSLLN